MHRILFVLAILSTFLSPVCGEEGWKAGVSSVSITPSEFLWMAGYGGRTAPAERKRTDLFAKALALEDAQGNLGVILTLDLVGIDREFANRVTAKLKEAYGLSREQIAICTSHTHSGPVVGRNLGPLHYYALDSDQQKKIDAYAEVLLGKIASATGFAITALAPARIQAGCGKCTFAVNRRENVETDVPALREKGLLKGPSDHDVPVLSIRGEDGSLRAVLFGYACHATVLNGPEWNGDYPGYAQAALEKNFPGAIALFWAGCGGDQNPVPRRDLSLAEQYGSELAARVGDVLKATMPELSPELETTYREIAAPLDRLPTLEQLQENATSHNRFEVARAKFLIRELEKKGALEGSYPYPIGIWKLGKTIDFVFLGGEVVIDYAVRLKKERHGTTTWIAAYANDVMAYIPSRRVLDEGGYEGGASHVYYGLPSLWAPTIEEDIVRAVHETGKK
jgi:neutral ceramidase